MAERPSWKEAGYSGPLLRGKLAQAACPSTESQGQQKQTWVVAVAEKEQAHVAVTLEDRDLESLGSERTAAVGVAVDVAGGSQGLEEGFAAWG